MFRRKYAAGPLSEADSGHTGDRHVPARPRRDLKKVVLIIGLSALAWVSTYTGMLELIQANLGEVSLIEKICIGGAVAMLQVMIVWLLDQMFSPIHFTTKTLYTIGYVFLSLISVGFAFGFYWKVLESRTESTRSAETSIGQVQNALTGAETRLDQLTSTLVTLAGVSTQKAEQEAANGNSCPGSKPGMGPRMAMRRTDAEKFTFASNFVKGRGDLVKTDIKALEGDLQRILKGDRSIIDAKSGTRNEFMRGMGRKLDETVTRYNALRTDPQLRQIRVDAAERAERTTFPDTKGGTYSCPDASLQSALRGVVAAIDQLPTLEKPKLHSTEGSEAVIEAFRRLTTTLFALPSFRLPPSPEELRAQQLKAVQSVENNAAAMQKAINLDAAGLGKRDYIPLGIAVFVDFCLLLVSFGRPMNRFVMARQHMLEAEAGPVNHILANFSEIHHDKLIRRNFELFQHVIFDQLSDYYVAVPLSAPRRAVDGRELSEEERERLQIEAQMLANLFAGLEKGSIIQRTSMSSLPILASFTQRMVRRKLRRQESKFAEAGAFRIYKFKSRAWPEMILGAIMGAAKRHEAELAEKRRLVAEFDAEERRAEAEERQAQIERRKAEAAQRKAEAELRRLEAERRRRALEELLASQSRPTMPPPGHIAPGDAGVPRSADGRTRPRPILHAMTQLRQRGESVGPAGTAPSQGHTNGHANGQRIEPRMPFGPSTAAAAMAEQRQAAMQHGPGLNGHHAAPPHSRAAVHGGTPVPGGWPSHQRTQPVELAPAEFVWPQRGGHAQVAPAPAQPLTPANHNTAPAPAMPMEARAGAGVVIPLPDRTERVQPPHAVDDVVVAEPSAHTMTQRIAPTPRNGQGDIAAMLKGVAVTQLKTAHDIAAVVHEIESQGHDAGRAHSISAAEHKIIEQAPASPRPGTAVATLDDSLAARERAGWQEANGIVHTEMHRELSGRLPARAAVAEDPNLSDTTGIALRFGPPPRS
jgi:hypothetical protein